MQTFHQRRSGLRRDEMAAQMPASGLKLAGSMPVITNLSKCGLMTDSVLSRSASALSPLCELFVTFRLGNQVLKYC